MEFWCTFTFFLATAAAANRDLSHSLKAASLTAIDERITGGQAAALGQFPYQVGLLDYLGDFFCGGILISSQFVLTTASCCEDTTYFEVVLGTVEIRNCNDENRVTRIVTGENKKMHEDYNSDTLKNDICLLRIEEVEFNAYINPIKLPIDDSNKFVNKVATASGWGNVSDSSQTISLTLQYVDMIVAPNLVCRLIQAFYGRAFEPSQLCTSVLLGRSICSIDSGGPLIVKYGDGEKVLVGIVLFIFRRPCELGLYDGYTRISSFLPWINANTVGVQYI